MLNSYGRHMRNEKQFRTTTHPPLGARQSTGAPVRVSSKINCVTMPYQLQAWRIRLATMPGASLARVSPNEGIFSCIAMRLQHVVAMFLCGLRA